MTKTTEKKVSFQTVGCRLNQYESEKMAADLKPYGFSRAVEGEPADLYIINTCTVTHKADATSRQLIHKAARENPNSRIVVAGCYVDSDAENIERMEAVDVIISNQEKQHIAEILSQHFPDMFSSLPQPGCATEVAAFELYNRAWLKISDGCNQACSFCILPDIRGALAHRPPNEIIEDIKALIRRGFEEIVITGVNIGQYRFCESDLKVESLASLCRLILERTDLKRLRISSIEPQSVSDEMLQVYADSDGRICRHIHLPLQSGSARILKLMKRPYTRELYLNRAKAIKNAQDNTIIGADVIVGFPGETEDDFNETKSLIETGLIDYLHVFTYSDRRGTVASEFKDKIAPLVSKDRNSILTQLSHKLRYKAHQRQVGQVLAVIPEHIKPGGTELFGISDNYLRVKLPVELNGTRKTVHVRATGATAAYIECQLTSC